MNSRLYRVIAGFLGAFVVISVAPRAPEIGDAVMASPLWPATWAMLTGLSLPEVDLSSMMPSGISLPQVELSSVMAAFLVQGDGVLPLALAATLTLLLVGSMTRRYLVLRPARPATAVRHARGLAVARASDRIVARARKDDSLGARIRQAAAHGERSPALARRFGVSQDAIRTATGRQPTIATMPGGKSPRTRPRASVVLPVAGSPLPKRGSTRAHA